MIQASEKNVNQNSLEYLALEPREVIDAHSVLLPTDGHENVLSLQHLNNIITDFDRIAGSTSRSHQLTILLIRSKNFFPQHLHLLEPSPIYKLINLALPRSAKSINS